jgi:hypothetical protein
MSCSTSETYIMYCKGVATPNILFPIRPSGLSGYVFIRFLCGTSVIFEGFISVSGNLHPLEHNMN